MQDEGNIWWYRTVRRKEPVEAFEAICDTSAETLPSVYATYDRSGEANRLQYKQALGRLQVQARYEYAIDDRMEKFGLQYIRGAAIQRF
jgi:hypothetical protein